MKSKTCTSLLLRVVDVFKGHPRNPMKLQNTCPTSVQPPLQYGRRSTDIRGRPVWEYVKRSKTLTTSLGKVADVFERPSRTPLNLQNPCPTSVRPPLRDGRRGTEVQLSCGIPAWEYVKGSKTLTTRWWKVTNVFRRLPQTCSNLQNIPGIPVRPPLQSCGYSTL